MRGHATTNICNSGVWPPEERVRFPSVAVSDTGFITCLTKESAVRAPIRTLLLHERGVQPVALRDVRRRIGNAAVMQAAANLRAGETGVGCAQDIADGAEIRLFEFWERRSQSAYCAVSHRHASWQAP